MSDPFGIAVGVVGIVSTFTACVDCFQYVQAGRNLGRDFQTDLITLHCVWLRLSRWGDAVNVYSDPNLGRPDASTGEIQAVKEALRQILILFSNAAQISGRYAETRQDRVVSVESDMDPTAASVADKMKHLAMRRRRGTRLIKSASWALYHKAELQGLINEIKILLDEIEALFPADRSIALARQEVAEMNNEALELVEGAARDVDSMLHHAAAEARAGHRYLRVQIQGKAQSGDFFASDWKGGAVGGFHTYDGVVVDKDGRALLGNKYGGTDFWDD